MLALTFHATKSRASGWHNSEAMTAGSTNQADMTIFPRVEKDPLRQERTNVKDSEIANNHHIHEYISLYSWYDRTNDVWMWCPLREPDSVQLDKHRGCVLLRRTFTKLNVTRLEFINYTCTHRTANTRSFSTENAKRQFLPRQLWFAIIVKGHFPPSGWKVRRSTYPYPGSSR